MITAGVDVGAATAKTAIVKDGEMIACKVMPTGAWVQQSARKVTEDALDLVGLKMEDLDAIMSTGYARHVVDFSASQQALVRLQTGNLHLQTWHFVIRFVGHPPTGDFHAVLSGWTDLHFEL